MHPSVLIRRRLDSLADDRVVGRLERRQRGQGMVEYALILVLIAVVVIVLLIVLGNQVQNVFCNISGAMGA